MGHPEAGEWLPVYVGMRNWRPYIPEVVRQMRADGVEEAAVICMAPQNSRTSVGLYRRAVEAEAGGLRIDFTAGWAEHPLLAEAFAERLRPAWAKLSAEVGEPVPVLFTAHSVPTRTVEAAAEGADSLPAPATRTKTSRGWGTRTRFWPGPGRARIPTQRTRGKRRNWWRRACRRFRDGGLPSRARARAAAVAGAQRGGDAGPDCGRGREGSDPSADRISLRSRGDSLRRRHPLSRICDAARHSVGAAGVVECVRDAGQGGCGSGATELRSSAALSDGEVSRVGSYGRVFPLLAHAADCKELSIVSGTWDSFSREIARLCFKNGSGRPLLRSLRG